jgi:hypothetical protein
MGKISNTWSLMGASWEVLKKDREILVFPLLSGICCLIVLASFAIPLFASGNWRPPAEEATSSEQMLYYATLFLFYFCNYLVMVIPILVVEKKTPIAALKESTALLKKTWGEQLISNVSFGLIFFLLAIPAFFLAMIGFFSGSGLMMIVGIGFAVIYFIGLALVQSALQAIFQSALYLYARQGQAPAGFQPELLRNAMTRR